MNWKHYRRISRPSIRVVGLLLAGTLIGSANAQELVRSPLYSTPREWTTKTGAVVQAVVVKVGKDNVTLGLDTGQERALPVENLVRDDESLLRTLYFGESDQEQLLQARSLVSQIRSKPQESLEVLKLSHTDFPDSPYSGLWASVCLSSGFNKYTEAMSMLRQAIDRIERQREFDVARHSMTKASALNNMAVCMLKAHKADAAAGLLSQSIGELPTKSKVVMHNARQLLEVGRVKNIPLTLNASSIQRLERAVKDRPEGPSGLPKAWFYTLDFDLPRTEAGGEPIAGIRAPRPGFTPLASATGLAVSSKAVVASASGLGMTASELDPVVTLVTINDDRTLRTLHAKVTKTDFQSNLVAIQTDESTLVLSRLSRSPAISSVNIAVFSFVPQNNQVSADALLSMTGKLSGPGPSSTFPILKLKKSLDGPVFDREMQLLGLSHRSEVSGDSTMTPVADIFDFTTDMRVETTPIDAALGFDQVRSSCVFVVRWQGPDSSVPVLLSQSLPDTAPASLSVQDSWCMTCQGVGFIDCEYGNCQKGVIVIKKRVQVGVNGLNGRPIFGNKNIKERCPKCSGRGGFDCPHCQNGKLAH